MAEGKSVMLDPKVIQIAGNDVRYAIRKGDVETLKEDILAQGGVLQPIEVEPLKPEANGFKYRVTTGERRLRAVLELNEGGAGLQIPAMVRPLTSQMERLQHQLSENLMRENLSLMDAAVSIKNLQANGASLTEIRSLFRRPGGRKGSQVKPASTAWVYMVARLLDLPKAARDLIHVGVIGLEAAYKLSKVEPDKIEETVAALVDAYEKRQAEEEKEEAKLSENQAKVDHAAKDAESADVDLSNAQAELELAQRKAEESQLAASEAHKAQMKAKGKDQKKAALETFRSAEADAKGATKRVDTALRDVDRKRTAATKAATKVTDLKAKVPTPGATKPAPNKKPIGAKEVKEAAAKTGATTGLKALSAAEIRSAVTALATDTKHADIAELGVILQKCFSGATTPAQMVKEIRSWLDVDPTAKPAVKPAKKK